MKKLTSMFCLFMLVVSLCFSVSTSVFALDDLDTTESSDSSSSDTSDNSSVTDYLKGYTPVTDQNMADASRYANPITNLIGTFVGFVVMIVSAGIFAVTVLDLVYIGLPFTRSFLNPQQQAQGGGGSMGMGMGMGMGMNSPQSQPQESGLRRRWVSDEALACVSQSSSQPQGGMPSMGMGGMGMGGMGMGGMGMGGSQQQSQPASTKSVITMYLKKRVFFLIVFTVATVLLTSSVFTDCGLNLAELSFKLIDKINSLISGVSI